MHILDEDATEAHGVAKFYDPTRRLIKSMADSLRETWMGTKWSGSSTVDDKDSRVPKLQ